MKANTLGVRDELGTVFFDSDFWSSINAIYLTGLCYYDWCCNSISGKLNDAYLVV